MTGNALRRFLPERRRLSLSVSTLLIQQSPEKIVLGSQLLDHLRMQR